MGQDAHFCVKLRKSFYFCDIIYFKMKISVYQEFAVCWCCPVLAFTNVFVVRDGGIFTIRWVKVGVDKTAATRTVHIMQCATDLE